jgi:uncharacterized protein (DUF927 family)
MKQPTIFQHLYDPIHLMNYLLKKNPDATIKDWTKAMNDIEEDRSEGKAKHYVNYFISKEAV